MGFFRTNKDKSAFSQTTLQGALLRLKAQMAFKLQDLVYQTPELAAFRQGLVADMVRKVQGLSRENFAVRQHKNEAVIAKLRGNVPLADEDVDALERILWSEVGTRQEYEEEYGQKPLGEFVGEIVGLDMNAAKTAFVDYLNNANLDSRQIYFVNQIVEYIVCNGMMNDLSVLQEAPFTDQGSMVEVFRDLSIWLGIRAVIDRINANALGAKKV